MMFCVDNAAYSEEIVECISESLVIMETPPDTKLARFYLVSDLLHNSCASQKNAWALRSGFEKTLPGVLEAAQAAKPSLPPEGAEKLFAKLQALVKIWEKWAVFSPQFFKGLNASLNFPIRPYSEVTESAWLEAKVEEWRHQHFSQLEKTCRMRGLPSNTSHLASTGDKKIEVVRRDWLIDRLVAYEMYHREQDLKSGDLDGESIDGEEFVDDIDGESCTESDFNDPELRPMFKLWSIEDLSIPERVEARGSPSADDIDGEPVELP